jgi:hypothetical protein
MASFTSSTGSCCRNSQGPAVAAGAPNPAPAEFETHLRKISNRITLKQENIMSTNDKITRALLAATAAAALSLAAANAGVAGTIAALQDGKTIAWIDTDKKAVTSSIPPAARRWSASTCVRPTASSTA